MDRPARVLVIDDENIRAAIKAALESKGYFLFNLFAPYFFVLISTKAV